MSLLLDALKKAAEQKSRQAREDDPGSDIAAEVARATGSAEAGYGGLEDSTEVAEDSTTIYEDSDRTEYTEASTTIYGDRTERTEASTEFVDDDTLAFEDKAQQFVDRTEEYQQDKTENYDESGFNEEDTEFLTDTSDIQAAIESGELSDVTELIDKTETRTIDREDSSQDTDFSTVVIDIDEHETLSTSFDEDETMSLEDVSDFLGDSDDYSDETVESKAVGMDVDPTEIREDVSLNLVEEQEDTTVNAEEETEGFKLVDYDRGSSAEQTATITADQNPTVTSGLELESLRHEHTIIRPDATSTHTYAPDNYDRTLIRPPNEDASRIFAGMKSEEDVLMTPDYAKRVFLSKSTANRVQHYKIYLGIAVSILLSVGIFSLFQLQSEYDQIDATLMPLKRDPMPGAVKKVIADEKIILFTESVGADVDAKTLKIVENAEFPSNESVVETPIESTPIVAKPGNQVEQVQAKEPVVASVKSQPANGVTDPVADSTAKIVANKSTAKSEPANQAAANFQITSNSSYVEKDEWLAEAYAAYQKGNYKFALQKYAQVLAVDPVNRNALLARAAIAVQNGNTGSAISDYQQLLLVNPKDSLAMSSLISVANTVPEQSESQLKLMIREEPDSPYLNFVLANIYGAQNRWQEAQHLYFKALENNPKDPNYAYNLAVSLEHIAKPKVAITYYERAISNIENGLATFNKDVVDKRLAMLRQL